MKLFFQKMGEGPVLIILHGLYGLSDNWLSFARKFSENFTVYLVDQRNHGRSPHSPDHSYALMSADLVELMNSEHIEKAYLMGHSMGGKTAMHFAAMWPDKLLGLIVVDIAPAGYATTTEYSPQAITHLNIVNTLQSIDLKQFTSRTEISDELAKTIPNTAIRQFLMKNIHREHDGSFRWKLNVDAISKSLPAMMGPVGLDKILPDRSIREFPILFIRGGRSNYLLPEHYPEIKKYFPGAEIETIPGAGHWVHADQPEKFLTIVLQFLNQGFR